MGNRKTHELYRAFNQWGYDARGYSATTRYQYYILALRAEGYLRTHRGRSLLWADDKDLKAFLFSLPASARTRNNARAALCAVFDFFVEKDLVQSNPAQGLPKLPVPRSIPKALSSEQVCKLLRAITVFGQMEQTLFLSFLYTGMRREEVRSLEWRHINGEWIRRKGKGNKERAIPLHLDLAGRLKSWRISCPSARWVFPSPENPERAISSTWVWQQVKELGDLAGLELHPHLFRHTVATRLLETGADLRTVQEFLGHASVASTTIYTAVRPARLAEAIGRLTYLEPTDK